MYYCTYVVKKLQNDHNYRWNVRIPHGHIRKNGIDVSEHQNCPQLQKQGLFNSALQFKVSERRTKQRQLLENRKAAILTYNLDE